VQGRELMLDHVRFPWFKDASLAEVSEIEFSVGHHLHWPKLDVDLHIDSIEHPERFPLLAKKGRKSGRSGRA
jgi:hypothetical protein